MPSYAMEVSDEMGNRGGGVSMPNMSQMPHRQTPESPMSHQEEDLSDPDLQDEESGEELPQQPIQANVHPPDATTTTTPPISSISSISSLIHLNNMRNADSQFLPRPVLQTEIDRTNLEALQTAMNNGGFNLPFAFPPSAAFLLPSQQQHLQNNHHQTGSVVNLSGNVANTSGNQIASSDSSHTSESSQGSSPGTRNSRESRENNSNPGPSNAAGGNHQQQTNWSFEEQFRQVRKLYDINDDPQRKEFLDDLFSFMQERGTPINRLPIMAKSVLDLHELFILVVARGGLVDVINKKLWQEIIKGLHLPSSITSAAFTLRTQYMKYLYPYECDRKNLSTPGELQAAIDGNRREGRRSNYAYNHNVSSDNLTQQRNSLPLHPQISPLSLVTTTGSNCHHMAQPLVNGTAPLLPLAHHSHSHSQHPRENLAVNPVLPPNMSPAGPEFEAHVAEYVRILNRQLGGAHPSATTPPVNRPGNSSSPSSSTPPREGQINAYELSKLTLWNMYNNSQLCAMAHPPPASPQTSRSLPSGSPEPQREALDLGIRTSPGCASPARPNSLGNGTQTRRDPNVTPNRRSVKRSISDDEDSIVVAPRTKTSTSETTCIKIVNRRNGKNENSLLVSMDLNGVTYEGVLFAQNVPRESSMPSTSNNVTGTSGNMIS